MKKGHTESAEATQFDPVNKPKHYNSHPSGIQCIEVTRHMGFNLGNVLKYIWRADLKQAPVEDLEKAAWYLNDEIQKRKADEMRKTSKKRKVAKKRK